MNINDAMFKELVVWQKSMELVDVVYNYIKLFPQDERFRLCDQLSRAAVSIPSNIAEGNGRGSKQEFAHFLTYARGSLFEVMTQLEIAKRQGYIKDFSEAESLTSSFRETGRWY